MPLLGLKSKFRQSTAEDPSPYRLTNRFCGHFAIQQTTIRRCGREDVKKSKQATCFDTVYLGCSHEGETPTTVASSSATPRLMSAFSPTDRRGSRQRRSVSAVINRAPNRPTAASAATATSEAASAVVAKAAAAVATAIPLDLFSLTRAGAGGNALKQIVLVGGAGRHRLVFEVDAGGMTPEMEMRHRDEWFEVLQPAL